MRCVLTAVVLILAAFPCRQTKCAADDRPNILWISCEDISAHLGCYGDANATTPNLDRLATEGVRYTRAFTPHGVCAPCRTGIITGMYPIGLGANHMRSKATLPEHVKCFPQYLKQAGYYCTNNSKTDYNFHWKVEDVWDESSNKAHWKNRRSDDQPFFAVFNLTMTHESRIWPANWEKVVEGIPKERLHDPAKIVVPPLYPDTPDVRAAEARLLDLIMVMDETAGNYLRELDEAGLADNTIVIFWSDHGDGFPRAKRWIYDTGTLVPMIARVPEKYRVAGQGVPGSVSDQLINLIDLGPTVLNLAGVEVPDHMFGQPFLGPNLPEPRRYIYGARDRVDERFDMVRSVRDDRYRYVRNFMPWRPALQHIGYSENSVVRKEMRRLLAEGRLHPESAQFLAPQRPADELYDLQNDPFELHNLAGDPQRAELLARLQQECSRWQLDVRDAQLIPEPILDAEEQQIGSRWGILHQNGGQQRCEQLLNIALIARQPAAEDAATLRASAASDDAAVRWWAATGLGNLPAVSDEDIRTLTARLTDASGAVRVAAARGLHRAGRTEDALPTVVTALSDNSEFVRHAALVELDDMGSAAAAAKETVKSMNASGEYVKRMVDHILGQTSE
ncbi:MAG: sulfatase-like hydrolase/transferase [Planctomycetaceae bacterium]